MKNLIIAIILIFAGLQTMQSQEHTMYVTTISAENGGAEIATNVFNSFGERCVSTFNDLQFDVEQNIYAFTADATSLNINGEEYTVLPDQVSRLTNEYYAVPAEGAWYNPALQPLTTAVNNRWTIDLSNRLFRSHVRTIQDDMWILNEDALYGTHTRGDVFFTKDVPVSTGETFRYSATYYGPAIGYAIVESRTLPTPRGGFLIITNANLNALMNCAVSRW